MKGLAYQLKSVRKDKFCIISFLLPIIVAAALHFTGGIDLSSIAEFHFGVLENDLSAPAVSWLERYGTVSIFKTQEELTAEINDPSTNVIGVKADGSNIRTMVSGDEIDLFCQTADTLPLLYAHRKMAEQAEVTYLERSDIMEGLQNIFIAITLIAAMFMGCTFNAVNIISEKENGIDFVNQILPVTQSRLMLQKIFVGFAGGCLSAVLTACICFRLPPERIFLMLALIILSSFVAALVGLFIGKFSESLMTGVVYIKVVMIVFMAVPVFFYFSGTGSLLWMLCYLVPSNAAFEGIMNLAEGGKQVIAKDMLLLMAHCVSWFLLYLSISGWKKAPVLSMVRRR